MRDATASGMDDRSERLNAFEARTQAFAREVIALVLGQSWPAVLSPLIQQLSKSATSVSANHRAVRRARSTREFASKLQVVNEEIDEAVHWLELLESSGHATDADRLVRTITEARQLRAMFAAARRTTRLRKDP
jgi:four helix bundle protein